MYTNIDPMAYSQNIEQINQINYNLYKVELARLKAMHKNNWSENSKMVKVVRSFFQMWNNQPKHV